MVSLTVQKHEYVLNGWKRCDYLKTNKLNNFCYYNISSFDLNNLINENKDLTKIAHPFMEQLKTLISDYLLIALVNKDGYIIDNIQHSSIKELKGVNFNVGARFSEEYNGNTAISTSVIENKPICLVGDDHYCDCYKDFATLSAPIYSDGKIIGLISVILGKDKLPEGALGIIQSVAKIISLGYKSEKNNKELNLRYKLQNAIVNSITDGLLIVDRNGYLEYINQIGAEILGIDRETSIGRHVSELVDFKPVVLDVLKTGEGYVDKEFILSGKSGVKTHFIKTAVPIKDENGNIVNVVDTFRKIKRVKKLINEMTGAYANFKFDDIVGANSCLLECVKLAKIAANSMSNVLIEGESGTGKELIAHSIHNYSDRRNQPFVTINCGAIPRELLESEFFGYEAGSFTGASSKGRTGKFELADGGTIFLDEIGEMPLDMQVKLLRVLQDKKITRIGGHSVFDVDVKIIAATNRDLLKMCEKGLFRKDLYYRINVLYVKIPPLRERKSDIPLLVEHFLKKYSYRLNKNVTAISPDALNYILEYDWPGNVRELENVLERAINICERDIVTLKELESSILQPCNAISIETGKNKNDCDIIPLEILEQRAIVQALIATNGNISQTAKLLKVTRNTIYNKLKKHEIDATKYQVLSM